jgi:hypothetical protein
MYEKNEFMNVADFTQRHELPLEKLTSQVV